MGAHLVGGLDQLLGLCSAGQVGFFHLEQQCSHCNGQRRDSERRCRAGQQTSPNPDTARSLPPSPPGLYNLSWEQKTGPHLPRVTTEPRVLRTPGVCTQGQGGLGDGWRNIGFLTHPSPNFPPPRGRQHPVQALHSVPATTYACVPPVPCRPKGGLDPALLHHTPPLPTHPFMPSPFPLPVQKTHRPGPHW